MQSFDQNMPFRLDGLHTIILSKWGGFLILFLCKRSLEIQKYDHSVYHAIPFLFFIRNQCICVFETGNVEFESLLRRHKSK